jgi:hypothetical protein
MLFPLKVFMRIDGYAGQSPRMTPSPDMAAFSEITAATSVTATVARTAILASFVSER